MKTTKKVLGVLLALTMLVGLLAVAPAAVDPQYAIEVWMEADQTSYSAGDTVTLTFSEKSIADIDSEVSGVYAVCYPAGKIDPISTTGKELSDQNFTLLLPNGVDNAFSGINLNADLEAMGYTNDPGYETISYCLGADGNTFGGNTKTDMFTVQFVIDASCPDGDYELYFNEMGYDVLYDGYLCGGIYSGNDYTGMTSNFKFNSVTIHVGAPATYDPAFLKAQCQWANGDTSSTLNVGLSATFTTAKFPIAFDSHGKSTNVTAVGIEVTSGAYTTTEETQYVYEVDASTYRYRAVITGVPHDATGTITATFYIIMGGVRYDGETKTINLGDVIAASFGNGLPAYTGA